MSKESAAKFLAQVGTDPALAEEVNMLRAQNLKGLVKLARQFGHRTVEEDFMLEYGALSDDELGEAVGGISSVSYNDLTYKGKSRAQTMPYANKAPKAQVVPLILPQQGDSPAGPDFMIYSGKQGGGPSGLTSV